MLLSCFLTFLCNYSTFIHLVDSGANHRFSTSVNAKPLVYNAEAYKVGLTTSFCSQWKLK